MNEARAGDLLKKGDTHPVVLNEILTELWPEWVDQEPETTMTLLRSFTKQTAVNPLIRTKVNALKVVHSSEGPWEDWEDFQWVTQAFNDNLADFSNLYRPDLGEMYISVEALNALRKEPFSEEVMRWMAAACLDQGLVYVPKPLDFVQKFVGIVDYRCTKCGNIDLDDGNKQCDNCGAPESALVRQPRYVDPAVIREAWLAIQNDPMNQIQFHESVKGVHLAKLAAAAIMAGERREQLKRERDYVRA